MKTMYIRIISCNNINTLQGKNILTGKIWDDQLNVVETCSQFPGKPSQKKNLAEAVPDIHANPNALQDLG